MPVLRIEGKGSGYWPTPGANESNRSVDAWLIARDRHAANGVNLQVPLRVAAILANTPSGNWPTPTCSDAFTDKLKSDQQKEGSMHSVNLSQAVRMWPTPRAANPGSRPNGKGGKILEEEVKIAEGERIRGEKVTGQEVGGQLNPLFVSWLMGWPLCWDDLKPLPRETFSAWQRAFRREPIASKPSETDKCPLPPLSHGLPSTHASKAAND